MKKKENETPRQQKKRTVNEHIKKIYNTCRIYKEKNGKKHSSLTQTHISPGRFFSLSIDSCGMWILVFLALDYSLCHLPSALEYSYAVLCCARTHVHTKSHIWFGVFIIYRRQHRPTIANKQYAHFDILTQSCCVWSLSISRSFLLRFIHSCLFRSRSL